MALGTLGTFSIGGEGGKEGIHGVLIFFSWKREVGRNGYGDATIFTPKEGIEGEEHASARDFFGGR